MKTFVVHVQWLEYLRGDYRRRSKRLEVMAGGICQASEKALAGYTGKICASVSCIWPKWPT